MDDTYRRIGGAWISTQAEIAEGNVIGAGCIIEPGVVIGPRNRIAPHVVIGSGTIIGAENQLMSGVVIATPSRQRLMKTQPPVVVGKNPKVVIGSGNVLHEQATVHLPVRERTEIGCNVAIGVRVHVAHDCRVFDGVIIAVSSTLGGYSVVGTHANLGIGVNVHPRMVIGPYAMCGSGSVIIRHVLPGATVAGAPARYLKPNHMGMSRGGLSPEQQDAISAFLEGEEFSDNPLLCSLLADFSAAVLISQRPKGHIPTVELPTDT